MAEQTPRSVADPGEWTHTPGTVTSDCKQECAAMSLRISNPVFRTVERRGLANRLVPALVLLYPIWLAAGSQAQGILYPRPEIRYQPFYVKNLRVNTVITDAVAETSVEQTFVNNSGADQEGTYLYPLPEGASPTSFTMTVGDKTMEPRILTKDEARGIYEGIVRRRRDPALLEYVGRNLVRVSVFPIPAQGERVIRLRYSEVLKPEGGLHKYAYALSTSRFGSRPVGTTAVSIKLTTNTPLKNIYSPSHDLSIRRTDERHATASWEGVNDASDRDLTLYYSTSGDDVGLSLLTYKPYERDGYFMLLASPRVTIPKSRILPKQVVFVLDRTGSMSGDKIKQARNALLYCLNSLHPQDRFSVITFNESPDVLFRHLVDATDENVAKAKSFVRDIDAAGGTNIDEALRAALGLLRDDSGQQKMVVFMTDGLPTVGQTDINQILKNVQDLNGTRFLAQSNEPNGIRPAGLKQADRPAQRPVANARIFCFGVGYDVNVPFLDRLGEIGSGDSDYVRPEEDIEVKVSSFFAKVTSPILSSLKLAFDGADVYDIYPKEFPDLFKGSQLVITGRFRGNGAGTVRLTGMANGDKESFSLGTKFADDNGNSFVPRIWAARKIGYLVDQMRLAGNPGGKQEVINEIVRLSRDYGIITEYTSFLVDEREMTALGIRSRNLLPDGITDIYGYQADNSIIVREVGRRGGQFGASGSGVVGQSQTARDYKNADKAASRYQNSTGSVYATLGRGDKGDTGGLQQAPGNFGGFGGFASGSAGRAGGLAGSGGGQNALSKSRAVQGVAVDGQVTVQAVNDRVFYLQKNNAWQDHSYDEKKQKLVKIQAYSDAHFALLRGVPDLAAYSSVGECVIVRLGKNAIEIGAEGKDKLTAAELRDLTGKG